MKKRRLLLGVSASIAAYKACEIISLLRRSNVEITVCMSKDAERFIPPLTLQGLSGNKVFKDMFVPVEAWDPCHISLANAADVVLVAPATYDLISKVACGICDDLLTCVIASTKAPVIFAPAMNEVMYKNKILQANIARLKKLGYIFIGPIKGRLACGTTGEGHLAQTDVIVKEVKARLR